MGSAAEESIDEVAETKQVFRGANKLRIRGRDGARLEVRPFSGNQGLTSVRQNQDEMQAAVPVGVSQDIEGSAVKRVIGARDCYPLGKVPGVGSVWQFPSTASRTKCW